MLYLNSSFFRPCRSSLMTNVGRLTLSHREDETWSWSSYPVELQHALNISMNTIRQPLSFAPHRSRVYGSHRTLTLHLTFLGKSQASVLLLKSSPDGQVKLWGTTPSGPPARHQKYLLHSSGCGKKPSRLQLKSVGGTEVTWSVGAGAAGGILNSDIVETERGGGTARD